MGSEVTKTGSMFRQFYHPEDGTVTQTELLDKLNRDLKKAAESVSLDEVQFYVQAYYRVQEMRIACNNQTLDAAKRGVPYDLVQFIRDQMRRLEQQIEYVLRKFAEYNPTASLSLNVYGIGPVIASCLVAEIPIDRTPYTSHLLSFAGLRNPKKWEKGQKRPWNAKLKLTCWKIGDSFVKLSNRPDCKYGQLYRQRKEVLVAKNAVGDYARLAERSLQDRNIIDAELRKCYQSGRMPDGRIDAWARRHVVELFLSHWFEAATWCAYNRMPKRPWQFAYTDHDPRSYVSPQDMGWSDFGDEEVRKAWREGRGLEGDLVHLPTPHQQ